MTGLASCGEVRPAIEAMQASLRRNPDQPRLQRELGLLWLELGEWGKAAQALAHAPQDNETTAAYKRLEAGRGRLGTTYARHLFNDYAPHFEEALAKLGYQAPHYIASALQPYLASSQRIIDLGCGTGLMAPYLKPHACTLAGVDIAEKMLALAARRNAYDRQLGHHRGGGCGGVCGRSRPALCGCGKNAHAAGGHGPVGRDQRPAGRLRAAGEQAPPSRLSSGRTAASRLMAQF